jgi:hypothetical protein
MIESKTLLICHQNEFYRNLIADMLSRLGFYHILEIESAAIHNLIEIFANNKDVFLLIQSKQINNLNLSFLMKQNFLILEDGSKSLTLDQSIRFGHERILTFPFTSNDLNTSIKKFF